MGRVNNARDSLEVLKHAYPKKKKTKQKTQTLKMRERWYPNGYLDLFTAEQCDIWPLIHSLNS